MSQFDRPIPDIEPTVQDAPIPEAGLQSRTSDAHERFKAIKAAFIKNYSTGDSVVDSYDAYKGELDKDQLLQDVSKEKADIDSRTLVDTYQEEVTNNPEIFETTAPIIASQLDELALQRDPNKEFVDAVANIETDEDVKKAAVNQIRLWEILQGKAEDITFLDYGMDLGTSLLPFVDTISEVSTLDSLLGNKEVVLDMITNFKALPHEQQQELFPQLADELIDGLGELRGMDVLSKFIEPATTEDDLSDFSDLWKIVDGADFSNLIFAMGVHINRLRKAYNVPKTLEKVGNTEAAGNASAIAASSDEASEAMNIPQESAIGNALPFDTSVEDIAHTGGISTETIRTIDAFFGRADKTIEDIIEGNGYLKEGILNSVERAAREKVALEQLSTAKHENIQVTGKTENTTTFSYKTKNEDGTLSDETYTLDLTLNDVGQWQQSEIGALTSFFASPTVFAKGLAKKDVQTAIRLDDQTAKVFKELSALQVEALKPLGSLLRKKNRARLAKVENALKEGDAYLWKEGPRAGERGKVFSVDELVGKYGLDEDEVAAYYNTNRLYNNLWSLRNSTKREEMTAFGFKRVDLLDDEYSFGKPFSSPNDALQSLRSGRATQMFDVVEDGIVERIDIDSLEEAYATGKILVRLQEPYDTGQGLSKARHVLVNADSVGELPAKVLSRREGYVPRVYEDGYWFVKEFADVSVDGATSNLPIKTLRYFNNKKDAETFRQQQIDKAVSDGRFNAAEAENRFQALEDREQEIIATATGEFSNGSGGLYTGARAEDAILFGLNGTDGTRLNAFEALSRNIANVSRLVPINQWRLGLEQRWINSARSLGVNVENFGELPGNIESTRKGQFLNKMAQQIRDWQGFPSAEEQIWTSVTQRMFEWATEKGFGRGAKVLGWMNSKDPISAARAAAFHSLLGWFNPVQLWTQAQGMSVAVSIGLGKNLGTTLQHAGALTYLGPARRQTDANFSKVAKLLNIETDELKEMHALWKKSGLEDSVLQTADHAAAIRGHGIAMDAVSKAADNGLLFYRAGELLARRTGFTVALDELKSGTLKGFENFKRGDAVNDDALKAVLDRTNVLTLNMKKANRAQWQKGALSVPFQFLQVTTKALETMTTANKDLSKAEAGRMFLGQMILYGTAGVPLINLAANYLLEVGGVTQEDLDNNPELVKAWNDGFWGYATLAGFGVDAEVSSRGSLIRGATDLLDRWLFVESSFAEKAFGAFGSTGQRFWDELMEQQKILWLPGVSPDAVDVVQMTTLPLLETISTWRNGEKAVFMETVDVIFNKYGDKTVKRDFSLREKIATAIGFQLSDEAKIYSLSERTRHLQESNKKIVDYLMNRINEDIIRRETIGLSEERIAETDMIKKILINELDVTRQRDINRLYQNRLLKDDKLSTEIRKYREKLIGNTADGLSTIRAGLLGTNLQIVETEE